MTHSSAPESFWDHLEEFRSCIFKCLLVVVVGMLLSVLCYDTIFNVLTKPLNGSQFSHGHFAIETLRSYRVTNQGAEPADFQSHADSTAIKLMPGESISYSETQSKNTLILFSPIEGMTTTFKIAFWVGSIGTSPLWLLLLLRFALPGIRQNERKLVIPFFLLSIAFLSLGFMVAYLLTIPVATDFLFAFNDKIGQNLWSLSSYIEFSLMILIANGLVFEAFVVLLFLIHLCYVGSSGLKSKRRIAVVASFIVGAVFTPPDVLTQVLLASLLVALYEASILYALVRERLQMKKKAAPN